MTKSPANLDEREIRLFKALDVNGDNLVKREDLLKILNETGFETSDWRLKESLEKLDEIGRAPEPEELPEPDLDQGAFCSAMRPNILLIEKILQGNLVIPDFKEFCSEINNIFRKVKENRGGKPADYIPQLNLPEPEADQFGVSMCSVDGQRHSFGDSRAFFTVQSTCKPVNYCLALEEHGEDIVHKHVGHEPSGVSFNELALSREDLPHNPMINAGAIMSSALIGLKEKRHQSKNASKDDQRSWKGRRFDAVMEKWKDLCGGVMPRFSTAVYLSEKETADRNFALAYFMREKGAFPEDVLLEDVLEFYFQSCSIELNTEMMSVVAATLANGGICPVTGERIFSTTTVQRCLSLMSSCGMYDYSGEFAFWIGLPAKSGVSGAVMIVIPNVMGFCIWSPRLDENGNSVRGIDFSRRLVEQFNFHAFDNLSGGVGKIDPRQRWIHSLASRTNEMIWAASKGDLGAVQELFQKGANPHAADYDLRTPLHLAAAEGRTDVIKYLLHQLGKTRQKVQVNALDRWGGRALDDALENSHTEAARWIRAHGGKRGPKRNRPIRGLSGRPPLDKAEPLATAELIWAAAKGNLRAIQQLVAKGISVNLADYDFRSPLHLAAAEGHLEIVEFLFSHGADPSLKDRWGHTALNEARKYGHQDVVDYLKTITEKRFRKAS